MSARLLAVRALWLLAIAVCALSLSACQHVRPYEREQLARPGMDTSEREQLRGRFYAHVYDAREGATGTTDSAGGGCGCN